MPFEAQWSGGQSGHKEESCTTKAKKRRSTNPGKDCSPNTEFMRRVEPAGFLCGRASFAVSGLRGRDVEF